MLRRLWRYGQKRLGMQGALDRTPEYRQRPRIPVARIMRVLLLMALAQLGSLRAMRTTSTASRWRAALLGTMPSDDTLGRGLDGVGPLPLRRTLARTVARLLGMKALRPRHGVWAIILDGHESHVSPTRHCPGCLMRRVQTKTGERREYYHRHVMAMLPAEPYCAVLDMEPQRPGEDEVAAASRLLRRIVRRFPRQFHVVLTDALYARADFVTVVRQQHLHLLTVLKQEERILMQEARALRALVAPITFSRAGVQDRVWDIPRCSGWATCPHDVRVIFSEERDGDTVTEWVWVTTLPVAQYSATTIVALGHDRWCIENHGFNELATYWHADHVYRHTPRAIAAAILLILLAYLVFHQFYWHNLRPDLRATATKLDIARQLRADLYYLPGDDQPDTS